MPRRPSPCAAGEPVLRPGSDHPGGSGFKLCGMIPCQRHLFDIPEDVAYLNCAYMSPLTRSALAAGAEGLGRKSHPWRVATSDFFDGAEEFRALAAGFFHCRPGDVAIVPSASYGIQAAADNVPIGRGQSVIVLDEQFPSNLYPWRRVAADRGARVVAVAWPADHDWTSAVLAHIGDDTAVVAVPNVQWTSGGLLDLGRIGDACRRVGAALVLDLTQSLGVLPFDVARVQPDFAVAAGYKWMMGPYSTGMLYVAPRWQDVGRPLEENWIQRENARMFSSLTRYTDGYEPGARRFDMGERSNFALLPAAIRAMEQLLAWTVEDVSATLGAVNRGLVARAADLGFSAPPEHLRAPHYLCLRRDGEPPAGLVEALAIERVFVSVRGASVRVTPHVYNSEADIERLIAVLRDVLRG